LNAQLLNLSFGRQYGMAIPMVEPSHGLEVVVELQLGEKSTRQTQTSFDLKRFGGRAEKR